MSLTPREYADVEAALGLAVEPVEPSAGLKASLMAKIAETPQLAPLTPGAPKCLTSRWLMRGLRVSPR